MRPPLGPGDEVHRAIHHEMVMIQDRVKKLREADRRLGPLVESLLDLMRLP